MSAPPGGLKAAMKPRHLIMMSLGSAIGTGLFVGSGVGIATAGPAVLLSYIIAGAIVLSVMRMLGEMVAADPNPGAFSYYTGKALGPASGFAIGWLWWIQMCLVVAAEAAASAQYLNAIVPGVPVWLLTLVIMVVFTGINLIAVGSFGEFEFWFSLLKVGFVVLFLVLGVAFLLGFTPAPSPGLGNLVGNDFMPTGISGVSAALLVVIFAFGGVEIVAVAAAETSDPERSIARAVRAILWRILIFYMGSVTIMLLALPWDDPELAKAPFVAVLNAAGLPALAATIAVVVVLALLSSLNANLYGGSRMVFSLSERRMGPPLLKRTNARSVPVPAVLATSAFGFASVVLEYFWPDVVLPFLLNMVGSTMIVTWIATILSHLVLRSRAEKDGTRLPMRMWAFPYLSWATLAVVVAVIALGFTQPEIALQLTGTFSMMAVLVLIGWFLARQPDAPTGMLPIVNGKRIRRTEADPQQAAEAEPGPGAEEPRTGSGEPEPGSGEPQPGSGEPGSG